MTRSFHELFKLNIGNALYYNFLTIPFILFIIYFTILFIRDLIKKETKSLKLITSKRFYIIVIIMLIISEIFNIIHGI